jgi:hypothetical protein
LDPQGKSDHIRKYWGEDKLREILIRAEEVVWTEFLYLSCVLTPSIQYKAQYIGMYGNGMAVPVAQQHTGKSSSKLGQLLRELSDDEDNVTPTLHAQRESSIGGIKTMASRFQWLSSIQG